MRPSELQSPLLVTDLTSSLRANGLAWLGGFTLSDDECWFPKRARQPRALLLVGNVGSAVWPFFDEARLKTPGLTLDRWTEDVVGKIAADFALDVVFPFKGPPYFPFIQWARRTGRLFSSPIGLTIHPDYGLWIAFRAALLIDRPLRGENALAFGPEPARHPCETCEDRPCLASCPVGAFADDAYDFPACLDHVATKGKACRTGGCLARIACPVGRDYRYQELHASFHMNQLLKAHGKV